MPTARSGPEDRQPVSISEHLDLLAMAEVIARRLRNQATVYAAIMAWRIVGASWAELADATGSDAGQMRHGLPEVDGSPAALHEDHGPGWVAPELKSTVQVLGPQVR